MSRASTPSPIALPDELRRRTKTLQADNDKVPPAQLARWYEAWNKHDIEAASALMTDDFRYEDPSARGP